eukprot:gene9181-10155_t
MDNDCSDYDSYCEGLHSSKGNVSPSTDNLFSNKDVLERRLKCRLEREDLISRGIMPPHHASPNLAAQIHQLERAKTGDLLQKKIRIRASRQQLIQRHILADSRVDASLQETQTALERHRIADQLNEQLYNRPGPLELIRENILEVEPTLADAVKHGCVPFHETCEDATSPKSGTLCESPPLDIDCGSSLGSLSPFATESIDTFSQAFSERVSVNTASDGQVSLMPSTYQSATRFEDLHRGQESGQLGEYPMAKEPYQRSEKPRDSCYTKKLLKSNKKSKQQHSKLKMKKYKYHEYKPPGSIPPSYQAPLDDRYKRLLEQQQMFLQMQVMKQNALFESLNSNDEEIQDESDGANNAVKVSSVDNTVCKQIPVKTSVSKTNSAPSPTVLSQPGHVLDDMRVVDLRSQLRQRGLPVSGAKAKLLERLKSYEERRKAVDNEERKKKVSLTETQSESSLQSQQMSQALYISSTAAPIDSQPPTISSSSGTIMKVTTYATQNGQTFQLVQAIPQNSQQPYQVIQQEPIIIGQNAALHPAQLQGIQPVTAGAVSQSQAMQLGKVMLTPDQQQHVYQNENSPVMLDNQQIQYIRDLSGNTSEQMQLHIAPVAATSIAQSYMQDKNGRIVDQNQQVPMYEQMSNELHSLPLLQHISEQKKQSTSQASDSYVHNQFMMQADNSQRNQLNDSNNPQSPLLLHLQQIRDSLSMPTTSRQQPQHVGTQQTQHDNNNFIAKSSERHLVYRDRAHTDPLRTVDQNDHQTFMQQSSLSASRPLVMQQNGTVVVVSSDGPSAKDSNLKREEIKPCHLSYNGMHNSQKNTNDQPSEDLMEILGEISSSAQSSAGSENYLSQHYHSDNSKKVDATKFPAFKLPLKQEPRKLLPSCSKQRQVTTRTYGSLPEDLNMLSANVHHDDAMPHSAHASCVSLTKNPSQSQSVNSPLSSTNVNSTSPIHMEDDCLQMDIDEGVYLTNENELNWLDLNATTNCEQKSSERVQNNKDIDLNACIDPMGFNVPCSTSYDHYAKAQDMALSIFDVDNHPIMMAVDSNDPDKWSF